MKDSIIYRSPISNNHGRKFAPFLFEENLAKIHNTTAVNESAEEVLWTHKKIEQKWATSEIIQLCEERRRLKNLIDKKKRQKNCFHDVLMDKFKVRKILRKLNEKWLNQK